VGAADVPVAIVDPEYRVIGAGALRFVDGAIISRSANGNIDALTVMRFIEVFNK